MYFPVSALLIEFMILSIVNREDSYGYEISQTIKLVADIKESTLYPILKKLEKAGYVTTYSAEYQAENGSIIRSQKQEKHRWRTCRANGSPIVTPLTTSSSGGKKNDEWGISETIGKVSEEASAERL